MTTFGNLRRVLGKKVGVTHKVVVERRDRITESYSKRRGEGKRK